MGTDAIVPDDSGSRLFSAAIRCGLQIEPFGEILPPKCPVRSSDQSAYTPYGLGFSHYMIPPFISRCPECGHVGLRRRFATVETGDGRRLVECPACHCRLEPIDNPWLL